MGCCLSGGMTPQQESQTLNVPIPDPQTPIISNPSPECIEQEENKEETFGPQQESPTPSILTPASQAPTASDPSPECAEQEQSKEANPGPGDELQPAPASMDTNEEIAITSIRAADVALGLGRSPAGFYAAVHHNDLEWRTENKCASANDDVEWIGLIPIPSDLSTTVRLEVYASFEFQPMLGAGEQLRQLTITVEQLLDRSSRDVEFTFFPNDGDVVSPCSSVSVTVERREREDKNPSLSWVVSPHSSTAESCGELEEATNRGHTALSCYRKRGRQQDLEFSIQQFERALGACPLDHPGRAAAQMNLATAKLILCHVKDTEVPLEDAIRLYRNALAARPVGHIDRPHTLIQLAAASLVKTRKGRDHVEEVQVESLLREAMERSASESPEKQAATFMLQLQAARRMVPEQEQEQPQPQPQPHVQSLEVQDLTSHLMGDDAHIISARLLQRFQRFGDLDDLQQAIAILEGSVRYTSIWDQRYIMALQNLGVALSFRFSRLGQLSDLEAAISTQSDAVNLIQDGDPEKHGCLNNLGGSLLTRFKRLGKLSDLQDALSMFRSAVDLTPHSHPAKPGYLNNLGDSLFARFLCFGQPGDLQDAISKQKDAVNLTPHDHPERPSRLNSLGNSFVTRFGLLGRLSDLEQGISNLRDAVDLTPHDHPQKPSFLGNLANSYFSRFLRLGQIRDIEDAISRQRDVIGLTPDGHPEMPDHLNNLGNSLVARFKCLGQLNDLQDGISMQNNAVGLTHTGHPHKPQYLSNLGGSFFIRFQRLGKLSDIENAISRQTDAVDLTPHDHPRKPAYLSNLGDSLVTRFERLGQLTDLENAILKQRDAVNLTPTGHPEKPSYLHNLGMSFVTRFNRFRQLGDIEDAISRHRDAVDLAPPDHPQKPSYLNSFGISLATRFEFLGQLSDLENAISRFEDAVHLIPDVHLHKPDCLNDLGNAYRMRFDSLGELSDLNNAILTLGDAVKLTPLGHPRKRTYLHNLGLSFRTRFEHLEQPNDLDDAISTFRDTIDLTPHGHPEKPIHLTALSESFLIRFEYLKEPSYLEQAISLFSCAASVPSGEINVRFNASWNWISCARRIRHHSLLHAYSVALSILPQLAWAGLSLSDRYSQLTQGSHLVREAAAAALDSGLPEAAVEWLEQGRAIVWGELFQLRGSYDELSSAHPYHARKLRELSAALDHTGATHEQSLSAFTKEAHESLQEVADRHRRLAIERDELLREIRKLPGFEGFLRPREFSQLRASIHSGPVVILNATETHCDALIVLSNVDHVIHVPLPNFTSKQAIDLQNTLKCFVRDARVGKRAVRNNVTWESFLSRLWKGVVKPVLDALALTTPGDVSRIFWCPTGPFAFLPIHAAGLYEERYSLPGHKVFDFVISSYIPILAILAPPRQPVVAPSNNLRFLVVPQPSSDGQTPLPGVLTELRLIKDIIEGSPSACTTLVQSSLGTVNEVLDLLRGADWCHFACHGVQDGVDSGLCLADGRRLRVRDIIAVSRPRGGLAFLSACQTATGEKMLSDEAIHITAGMLFAGYSGVVGTMWSISDRLAPVVTRGVYAQLFAHGTRPDYRDAARALHDTMGRVRESGRASFVEWVPFIHVGL